MSTSQRMTLRVEQGTRVYGPALVDLCGPVWFERNYKFVLRRLPGRGSSGFVDPLSFRPQTAQEPFPCFRASPGYDEFGDDVPPE